MTQEFLTISTYNASENFIASQDLYYGDFLAGHSWIIFLTFNIAVLLIVIGIILWRKNNGKRI